jgi:hypothetical protein
MTTRLVSDTTDILKLISWSLRRIFLIPSPAVATMCTGIAASLSHGQTRTMFHDGAEDRMAQLSAIATKLI